MDLKESKLSNFPLNYQLDKNNIYKFFEFNPNLSSRSHFHSKVPTTMYNVGALFQQQMIWLLPSWIPKDQNTIEQTT